MNHQFESDSFWIAPYTKKAPRQRDYSADNIRFLLIFAVVFAHFLEIAAHFPGSRLLYKLIYTFHMPAFLFLFGYYARFEPRRILFRWMVPYFIFQTLYLLFTRYILKSTVQIQYATPHWLLWYMLVCIFYQLLIPVYNCSSTRAQLLVLGGSVVLALLAGFDQSVGYYLSLSRFLVFQPWFLLGFYCRKNAWLPVRNDSRRRYLLTAAGSVLLIAASALFLLRTNLPNPLLYGSLSYSSAGSTVWMRAASMVIALNWIVFLFYVLKPFLNRHIFAMTYIGQNTLPIFLLHGFLVKLLPLVCPELLYSPWRLLLLSLAVLVLTGNTLCKAIIDFLCLSWLDE